MPKLMLLFVFLCVGKIAAQPTTVRPYQFGYSVEEQQHRYEKRDERGIVMGEFGFITADGIYHVTVYATDEEGKFRILAMKNYPYKDQPKIDIAVPVRTTTSTTTSAPKTQDLVRKFYNAEACSGCTLLNGKPKGDEAKAPAAGVPETPLDIDIRTAPKPGGAAADVVTPGSITENDILQIILAETSKQGGANISVAIAKTLDKLSAAKLVVPVPIEALPQGHATLNTPITLTTTTITTQTKPTLNTRQNTRDESRPNALNQRPAIAAAIGTQIETQAQSTAGNAFQQHATSEAAAITLPQHVTTATHVGAASIAVPVAATLTHTIAPSAQLLAGSSVSPQNSGTTAQQQVEFNNYNNNAVTTAAQSNVASSQESNNKAAAIPTKRKYVLVAHSIAPASAMSEQKPGQLSFSSRQPSFNKQTGVKSGERQSPQQTLAAQGSPASHAGVSNVAATFSKQSAQGTNSATILGNAADRTLLLGNNVGETEAERVGNTGAPVRHTSVDYNVPATGSGANVPATLLNIGGNNIASTLLLSSDANNGVLGENVGGTAVNFSPLGAQQNIQSQSTAQLDKNVAATAGNTLQAQSAATNAKQPGRYTNIDYVVPQSVESVTSNKLNADGAANIAADIASNNVDATIGQLSVNNKPLPIKSATGLTTNAGNIPTGSPAGQLPDGSTLGGNANSNIIQNAMLINRIAAIKKILGQVNPAVPPSASFITEIANNINFGSNAGNDVQSLLQSIGGQFGKFPGGLGNSNGVNPGTANIQLGNVAGGLGLNQNAVAQNGNVALTLGSIASGLGAGSSASGQLGNVAGGLGLNQNTVSQNGNVATTLGSIASGLAAGNSASGNRQSGNAAGQFSSGNQASKLGGSAAQAANVASALGNNFAISAAANGQLGVVGNTIASTQSGNNGNIGGLHDSTTGNLEQNELTQIAKAVSALGNVAGAFANVAGELSQGNVATQQKNVAAGANGNKISLTQSGNNGNANFSGLSAGNIGDQNELAQLAKVVSALGSVAGAFANLEIPSGKKEASYGAGVAQSLNLGSNLGNVAAVLGAAQAGTFGGVVGISGSGNTDAQSNNVAATLGNGLGANIAGNFGNRNADVTGILNAFKQAANNAVNGNTQLGNQNVLPQPGNSLGNGNVVGANVAGSLGNLGSTSAVDSGTANGAAQALTGGQNQIGNIADRLADSIAILQGASLAGNAAGAVSNSNVYTQAGNILGNGRKENANSAGGFGNRGADENLAGLTANRPSGLAGQQAGNAVNKNSGDLSTKLVGGVGAANGVTQAGNDATGIGNKLAGSVGNKNAIAQSANNPTASGLNLGGNTVTQSGSLASKLGNTEAAVTGVAQFSNTAAGIDNKQAANVAGALGGLKVELGNGNEYTQSGSVGAQGVNNAGALLGSANNAVRPNVFTPSAAVIATGLNSPATASRINANKAGINAPLAGTTLADIAKYPGTNVAQSAAQQNVGIRPVNQATSAKYTKTNTADNTHNTAQKTQANTQANTQTNTPQTLNTNNAAVNNGKTPTTNTQLANTPNAGERNSPPISGNGFNKATGIGSSNNNNRQNDIIPDIMNAIVPLVANSANTQTGDASKSTNAAGRGPAYDAPSGGNNKQTVGGNGGIGGKGGIGGVGKTGNSNDKNAQNGGATGTAGDLYRFKYILDYNGHEEMGSRNGDKEGSYFIIGKDNVEHSIEYVANEFGYQPHIHVRKLDAAAAAQRPSENTLKEYEFVWFNKKE